MRFAPAAKIPKRLQSCANPKVPPPLKSVPRRCGRKPDEIEGRLMVPLNYYNKTILPLPKKTQCFHDVAAGIVIAVLAIITFGDLLLMCLSIAEPQSTPWSEV